MRSIYHFTAERESEDLPLDGIGGQYKVPGYLAQYLKKFQLDGIRFLFRNYHELNQSCILNDDNGLGKTLQVVGFLQAIFAKDSTKKCLIFVKNEEQLIKWKFHLNVFTKFPIKIVSKKAGISNGGGIYLNKWNTNFKYFSLHDISFDFIILDDRGELLSNKICLNFFLKHYLNKISLIIASIDIAIDLNLLHNMLKLCGLLDKDLENYENFENKFGLPSNYTKTCDKNILEAYFIRREKIISFCRDFRLRRYWHQYENDLPLSTQADYEKSIKLWNENPNKNASSFSSSIDSIKIISSSSSSDRNTEELFESYFMTKEERKLNKEISNITENITEKSMIMENNDEITMSPLLFEETDNEQEPEIVKSIEKPKTIKNTLSKVSKISKNKTETSKSKIKTDTYFFRQTRSKSGKITRSKAQKNKFIVPDITVSLKRFDYNTRRISKRSIKKEKNTENTNIISNIIQNDINELPNQIQTDVNNTNIVENETYSKDVFNKSKYDFKIDLLSEIPRQDRQNSPDICIITPSEATEDQIIILTDESSNNNKNSREIINISQSPDLFTINLINNDDYNITCTQKRLSTQDTIKNNQQKNRENIKKKKSCLVMLNKKYLEKTNLIAQNNSTENTEKQIPMVVIPNNIECNDNFTLTTTSPYKNKLGYSNSILNTTQNNKITKYLIRSSPDNYNTIGNELFSTNLQEVINPTEQQQQKTQLQTTISKTTTTIENLLETQQKTPKHQIIMRKSQTTCKKSPKSNLNTSSPTLSNFTPKNNSLTRWLIQSSGSEDIKTTKKHEKKNLKRRRLDICFQKL